MKNQITKKLSAFIIIAMMFSINGIAQKIKSGCDCNVYGYGCGLNQGCEMICIKYCRNHHARIANEEPNAVDVTSFIGIYPNPVSNLATISFFLEQSGNASLKIFDLNGRLVKTLAENIFEAGENEIVWNAENVNGGIYFLQFQSEENLLTEKLIVTK